jgi:MYXO-CTERM domain-containing protein
VDATSEPAFEPAPIHVPLPDVATVDDALAFGRVPVGSRTSGTVRFRNDGEADLWVRPIAPEPPFEVAGDELRLPPRSERSVPISFAPTRAGVVSGLVAFATNDPDRPTFTVRVAGEGALGDAGPGDASVDGGRPVGASAGGCGCRAGRRTGPLPAGLALLALAVVVRRRRGRVHPK